MPRDESHDADEPTILPDTDDVAETIDASFHSAEDTAVPATGSAPTSDTASDSTGSHFGDYELLHEIARGGMGVVYKARQTKLNRIVALKMIKSGELAGDEEVKRFHAEAEAAAALDHPNIVPIYEVGEWRADGVSLPVHFFSMAYVEGAGLDARLKDGPLPPRDAAELIKQIAVAVQYAHDKGIVHRDLKPANVLLASGGRQPADGVDSRENTERPDDVEKPGGLHPPLAVGIPRITDFGLAKNIAADSGMTATGQILGTPSYMPPEQAAGKTENVGPLADVYSLGAMLYATLTGRPPFQSANVMETLKQVLEREPVSPQQLNPAVDKDLETIVLKCLEKDAAKRYASAHHLADELDRFLTHKPILARPVGRWERGLRWCKRNPLGATVIALLTILAIGGPVVAINQKQLYDEAQSEKALTYEKVLELAAANRDLNTSLSAEAVERQRATTNRDKADGVVQDFFMDIGREDGPLGQHPGTQPLRRYLLRKGRDYYEELIAANPDAGLSPRLASAYYRLGIILAQLSGEHHAAITAYRESLAKYGDLARNDPSETKYQNSMAIIHNNLGVLHAEAGEATEALAAYQHSIDIGERLVRANPKANNARSNLAASLVNSSVLIRLNGNLIDAMQRQQRALTIQQQLANDNPKLPKFWNHLAAIHINTASTYGLLGKVPEQLASLRQALGIQKRLVRERPEVVQLRDTLAAVHINLGGVFRETDRPSEALTEYQRSLKIVEQLARDNPSVKKYQFDLATVHVNLGGLNSEMDNPSAALSAHKKVMGILEVLVRRNPSVSEYQESLAESQNNVGNCILKTGNPTEALALHQKSLKLRKVLVLTNPKVPLYRRGLATTYHSRPRKMILVCVFWAGSVFWCG